MPPPFETPAGLLARLAALGIEAETVEHPPLFTVAESKALRGGLPGLHAKSLFLEPRAGPRVLAVLEEDRRVSINALGRLLGVGRLGFATPGTLLAELGVAPGSVTPFALVNAAPGTVRVVLDRVLAEAAAGVRLNFHPLVNTATTAIRPGDLLRFLRHLGHEPAVIDPPAPAPAGEGKGADRGGAA
ncbi:prolyl-tRNA synthetase associated domain-containing protein [Roseomonas sp. NAR14]|uniref:Prolyl-tRNA synthetase associated domain-containing protein n=1 Tax=Roseomonas acroporae TaxID=2937791 RepID=A0A9X1YBQ2_9PROT|nr:prolyl-tRNA synthetase associated domain-containing protein [Roseomonas acroporae]MCK8785762.1 prolyl-tRNA synthetase associated domain-containing protein [Roseomonas acroporae]